MLYKLDSKGKLRTWECFTEGAEVVVISGLKDGRKTEKRYVATPKNVGKGNETTAEQQAFMEAASKRTKQIDRNQYYVSEVKALTEIPEIFPMLARDYRKLSHQVKWGDKKYRTCAKLDGIRCLTHPDGRLMSRKGLFYNIPHLTKQVVSLFQPGIQRIDAEIYLHGEFLTDITGAAKKHRDLTDQLELHIFDVILDDLSAPFIQRLEILNELPLRDNIKRVEYFPIDNEEKMKNYHNQFRSEGYEGVMIRDMDEPYVPARRTVGLFKYKEFEDSEFRIIRVDADKDGYGKFVCVTKDGKEFTVRPKGTDGYRLMIIKRPELFIGKYLTTQFLGYTPEGKPNHGIGLTVRDYE